MSSKKTPNQKNICPTKFASTTKRQPMDEEHPHTQLHEPEREKEGVQDQPRETVEARLHTSGATNQTTQLRGNSLLDFFFLLIRCFQHSHPSATFTMLLFLHHFVLHKVVETLKSEGYGKRKKSYGDRGSWREGILNAKR